VLPAQVALINDALTPGAVAVERARRVVAAFEAARAEGRDGVEVDGNLIEVPSYLNAKRLIARHEELRAVAH
jgi:citrate lyase subunit beta/citryl-CoA lyase